MTWAGRLGVILLALALSGCDHTHSTPTAKHELARLKRFAPPKTQPARATTTTSMTLPPASKERDALALAKGLGCDDPTINSSPKLAGFPTPTQAVSCTIGFVDINVEVFRNHADLAKAFDPTSRKLICALYSAFGSYGQFYMVNGADFSVTATTHETSSPGTLAEAKALSRALGLPITRITC